MIKHSRHHHADSAIIYGLAVLAVLVLANIEKPFHFFQESISPQTRKNEIKKETITFDKKHFSNIQIRGKAYVVYDIVGDTVVVGKNANVSLPLASITKIMTLVTARLHHNKDKKIVITSKSLDNEGGYDLGLKNGQVWTLNELLKYTLVISSNDGSRAIADSLGGRKIFVDQMNKDAQTLGLDLHFTHPSGLDENGQIGGKGSALSVAKLFAYARRSFPEILDATTKTRVSVVSNTGKISGIPNTNQKVYNLEGLEASKTGFTDLAGANLAVIVDVGIGNPVVIVVLGSTHEERFSDVEKLQKALQKSIVR